MDLLSQKSLRETTYTLIPQVHIATGEYDWSGTRGTAHPDPDNDPEIQNKSSNSARDPSIPDQRMQYLKVFAARGVRPVPVPYLFHTRSIANKVFSSCSPHITCGNQQESVTVPDPPHHVCDPDPPDQAA